MKRFIKLIPVFVFAVLFLCGCSDNALSYVPKDAQAVFYGNTKVLLKHKFWTGFTDSRFGKVFLKELDKELGLAPDEFEGNVAVFSCDPKKEHFAGVVILKNSNAENIMDAIKKAVKKGEYFSLEEKELDGDLMFFISKEYSDDQLCIVQTASDTIQFSTRNLPEAYSSGSGSEIAGLLNPDAVAGIAVKGELLNGLLDEKEDFPKYAALQIFATDKQIKIEGSVDIDGFDIGFDDLVKCANRGISGGNTFRTYEDVHEDVRETDEYF